MFITFEGGEGTGKSTQIQKLYDHWIACGHSVLLTREPGGLPMCEDVRRTLFSHTWSPMSEFLLFSASRHELCQQSIVPALKSGNTVICDRFTDSSRVYQGYVLGVSSDFMESVIQESVPVQPDLTIVLDMDPVIAHARLRQRTDLNHMDHRPMDFHKRVRAGFLKVAEENPKRCRVVNADQEADVVFKDILKILPF